MKVPRKPRTVHYKSSQDTITSFSGLKFIADIAHKLGILKGLERCTIKKRARGIPVGDFVMSLVYNLLAGGSHLSDLEALRSEAATREHLYEINVPAPTTAGEYLAKFTTGHIKQLEGVTRMAVHNASRLIGGDGPITLDLDSSIFPVYGYLKEGARYGYTKVKGLPPLLCFWAQHRLLVGVRLRSGNKASAQGAKSFLRECLSRLPERRMALSLLRIPSALPFWNLR